MFIHLIHIFSLIIHGYPRIEALHYNGWHPGVPHAVPPGGKVNQVQKWRNQQIHLETSSRFVSKLPKKNRCEMYVWNICEMYVDVDDVDVSNSTLSLHCPTFRHFTRSPRVSSLGNRKIIRPGLNSHRTGAPDVREMLKINTLCRTLPKLKYSSRLKYRPAVSAETSGSSVSSTVQKLNLSQRVRVKQIQWNPCNPRRKRSFFVASGEVGCKPIGLLPTGRRKNMEKHPSFHMFP